MLALKHVWSCRPLEPAERAVRVQIEQALSRNRRLVFRRLYLPRLYVRVTDPVVRAQSRLVSRSGIFWPWIRLHAIIPVIQSVPEVIDLNCVQATLLVPVDPRAHHLLLVLILVWRKFPVELAVVLSPEMQRGVHLRLAALDQSLLGHLRVGCRLGYDGLQVGVPRLCRRFQGALVAVILIGLSRESETIKDCLGESAFRLSCSRHVIFQVVGIVHSLRVHLLVVGVLMALGLLALI